MKMLDCKVYEIEKLKEGKGREEREREREIKRDEEGGMEVELAETKGRVIDHVVRCKGFE